MGGRRLLSRILIIALVASTYLIGSSAIEADEGRCMVDCASSALYWTERCHAISGILTSLGTPRNAESYIANLTRDGSDDPCIRDVLSSCSSICSYPSLRLMMQPRIAFSELYYDEASDKVFMATSNRGTVPARDVSIFMQSPEGKDSKGGLPMFSETTRYLSPEGSVRKVPNTWDNDFTWWPQKGEHDMAGLYLSADGCKALPCASSAWFTVGSKAPLLLTSGAKVVYPGKQVVLELDTSGLEIGKTYTIDIYGLRAEREERIAQYHLTSATSDDIRLHKDTKAYDYPALDIEISEDGQVISGRTIPVWDDRKIYVTRIIDDDNTILAGSLVRVDGEEELHANEDGFIAFRDHREGQSIMIRFSYEGKSYSRNISLLPHGYPKGTVHNTTTTSYIRLDDVVLDPEEIKKDSSGALDMIGSLIRRIFGLLH